MLFVRLLYLLIFLCVSTTGYAQVKLVTTILPLQLIANEITSGISNPSVILDGSQDPHHPALRPSQRQQIGEAQIFVWVGPALETGFDRIIGDLDARVVTIMDLPINIHALGDQSDPHVWLDTSNAAAIAESITSVLADLDPGNEAAYRNNLGAFQVEVAGLEKDINQLLDTTSFPPYVVYHDAFQYFEKQAGLAHQASFTGNEEIQPGIRKILEVKNVLETSNARCIIVNNSVNTEFVENQLDMDGLRFVEADVLGSGLDDDLSYYQLMLSLANAFNRCRL